MVEFTEMAMPPSNFSMSHLDHIRVNSTLSLCAWITLFHVYKVLQGKLILSFASSRSSKLT